MSGPTGSPRVPPPLQPRRTLTASPITSEPPSPGSPTTTSPVLMPILVWSATPQVDCSASFSAGSALLHLVAAAPRAARRPREAPGYRRPPSPRRRCTSARTPRAAPARPRISSKKRRHDAADGLWLQLLAEGRGSDDVAEQDGEGLARFGGRAGSGQRVGAGHARTWRGPGSSRRTLGRPAWRECKTLGRPGLPGAQCGGVGSPV